MKGGVAATVVAAVVTAVLCTYSGGCGTHRVREPHPVLDAVVLAAGKALDQLPPDRQPSPSIQVDPPMIAFGLVGLRSRETRTALIRNVSAKPAGISTLSVTNKAFRVEPVQLPATIEAGGEFEVRLRFEPAAYRKYVGTLVITMMSAEIVKVPLDGRAR